MIRHVDMK